jgi:CDP-glucose 4,6-dehydratase
MTFLLEHLHVPVVGYSLAAEKESLFDRAERIGVIPEVFADIRDYNTLEEFIDLHKPSTIIHMAAQPLVLKSYENPRETFDVNVMGTVNVLDIAFKKDFVNSIIVVTSDKVYRNDDSGRAFVESDPLGGKDPYSASKVGAEAVVAAWQQITKVSGGPRVISVRAGNVIGGGDFAENRIIPDLIRGVIEGNSVMIRNPNSTRPWQHITGLTFSYLVLLENLIQGFEMQNTNLGPSEQSISVNKMVQMSTEIFPELSSLLSISESPDSREAKRLSLDVTLSQKHLYQLSQHTQEEAITCTFRWWYSHLNQKISAASLCQSEIKLFMEKNFKEF